MASLQDALQRIKSYGGFFENKSAQHSPESASAKLNEHEKTAKSENKLKDGIAELYAQDSADAFKKIDEIFYKGSFSERTAAYEVISEKIAGLENTKLKSILADESRPRAERQLADFCLQHRLDMAASRAKDLHSLIPRMAQEYCDPLCPEDDFLDAQDAAEERIQRVAEKIEEIESRTPRIENGEISETLDGEKITYYTDDTGKVAGFRVGNISEKSVHEYRIPNAEYTLNGFTYHTDAQGRVTMIEGPARFEGEDSTRNQRDQKTSGGMDRADSDDGGHLVAKLLGGDASWLNIVPMDSKLNRGDYKAMESTVAKMLENGENPKIKIEVKYDDQQGIRPSGFTYTAETNEKKIQRVFDNVLR